MALTIKQAVEKELKRSACSTTDAWFLGMLGDDLAEGNFDTNRVDVVRKKYGISARD